jgi:hypothetical protein
MLIWEEGKKCLHKLLYSGWRGSALRQCITQRTPAGIARIDLAVAWNFIAVPGLDGV